MLFVRAKIPKKNDPFYKGFQTPTGLCLQEAGCDPFPQIRTRWTRIYVDIYSYLFRLIMLTRNFVDIVFPDLYYNAGELPPTLQSTVIRTWNCTPQLPGKITQTSSPIVNAEQTCNNYKSKQLTKHHEKASHPNGFNMFQSRARGNLLTTRYKPISKHNANAWFMYVLVRYLFCSECSKKHKHPKVVALRVETARWTHDS